MVESNLRVVGRQIEIVEVDEVPELDGDPLGAGEARLVQRKLQLPVELEVPEQVRKSRGLGRTAHCTGTQVQFHSSAGLYPGSGSGLTCGRGLCPRAGVSR